MSEENGIKRYNIQRWICLGIVIACVAVLFLIETLKPSFFEDDLINTLFSMSFTRLLGAAAFFAVLIYCGYNILNPVQKPFLRSLLFCIPAFLVVVNNMPILSMIHGDAYLVRTWEYVLLFALQCLAIGLFEEAAFRGVIFLSVLEGRRKSKKDIFISLAISAVIFGAVHLVNLFMGASPGAVFLQMGYSALIGAMCSVVLLKTANIWLCVLLHAIYDFCGHLIPTLGKGTLWNTPTVIFTAILAVAVAAFMTVMFFKIEPGDIERIFKKKNK